MAHYGPEEWFYANGALAANQRAAVFGPGNDNTYAPIFSDPGMTVPLANPTTTDANGLLEFYAADGQYWVFVGPEATGDSVLVTLGASPDNPVLSVNGIAPDGAGNVELTATDVGAQPISTINAAGDLYVGTGNDATTRLPAGTNGEVLTIVAGVPSWEPGGGGAVDSVNGQTGVVVLDAGDVGADPAGSAAAAQAAAIAASQSLSTIDALGDLYVGTGNNTTTRLPRGADGEVLASNASEPGGLEWIPAPGGAVDSVNGQTGVVVLDAGDVGAVPVTLTPDIVYGTTTAGAPLNREVSTIASPDTIAWRTGDEQLLATTVADGDPAAGPDDLTNRAYVQGELAGYIPESIIDAAGDLIVGSAADTAVRLAPGTNGEVLTIAAGVPSWEPAPADAVDSVNGQTGVVVLDAGDVGAQPIATITQKGGLYVGTGAATVIELAPGANGEFLSSNSGEPSGLEWVSAPGGGGPQTTEFTDDRKVITTGNGIARWYNRQASLSIVGVWVSAGVQPTGAAIIVDVNLNGTTIFTTQANRPTVPAASNGGALSATPDVTALAVGDYLTVDIDQIGSTIPGGAVTVGIIVQ